jgi:thiamine pyrophosphate-dependent acetolactate synthase large subunit-like protein
MNINQINREITVELNLEHGERLLLRKAGSADYVEAPFKNFKKEYTPEDLDSLSKMLKDANRIGVFTGDERTAAGKIATELRELSQELNYPTRFN